MSGAATTNTANASPPGAAKTSILGDLASSLAAGGDLHELLQRFLAPVMRIAGARAGAVRVLSASGEQLEMVSQLGLPDHVVTAERWVDRTCGACGAAFARDVVVCDSVLLECARHGNGTYFGHECRHVVAVPMNHGGHVLGQYTLFYAQPTVLAPDAAALLKTIGELLGLALHNARLERENLQATVLAERQAFAAEVHDSVAQTLAFVKMRMPLLEAAVRAQQGSDALRYCADVRQAVSGAHTNLRHILTQFRAPMDPLGLKHALHSSILSFNELTQVELSYDDRAPDLRLSAAQESQVFRIVQEALANIAKHAGAQHAWLTIERAQGRVELLVEDDGAGMADSPPAESHFGIDIMRQRAQRLGGDIEVGPRAGGGTRLRVHFPDPAGAAS
ncbi:MAG TPA: ATP-binding protein [Burkholderiaceae bacterium]|nr:ATP-binding protein [Burkholderiaceae bacterium]